MALAFMFVHPSALMRSPALLVVLATSCAGNEVIDFTTPSMDGYDDGAAATVEAFEASLEDVMFLQMKTNLAADAELATPSVKTAVSGGPHVAIEASAAAPPNASAAGATMAPRHVASPQAAASLAEGTLVAPNAPASADPKKAADTPGEIGESKKNETEQDAAIHVAEKPAELAKLEAPQEGQGGVVNAAESGAEGRAMQGAEGRAVQDFATKTTTTTSAGGTTLLIVIIILVVLCLIAYPCYYWRTSQRGGAAEAMLSHQQEKQVQFNKQADPRLLPRSQQSLQSRPSETGYEGPKRAYPMRAAPPAEAPMPPRSAEDLQGVARNQEGQTTHIGPPAISPALILPNTEARFVIPLEPLLDRTVPRTIDILGFSGRVLLHCAVVAGRGGQPLIQISSVNCQDDPRASVAPAEVSHSGGLSILARYDKLYGSLEPPGSSRSLGNPPITVGQGHAGTVVVEDKPVLVLNCSSDQDLRLNATAMPEGQNVASAGRSMPIQGKGISDGPVWKLQVRAGADAILVLSAMLGVLVLKPWPLPSTNSRSSLGTEGIGSGRSL